MITDLSENSLLYCRVIVKSDSPKYPNRHGMIVGLSGTEQLYAHVSIDAYGHAPARRREMFPLETLTVQPKGDK